MNAWPSLSQSLRRMSALGLAVALLAAGPIAAAQDDAPPAAARYIPSERLVGYLQFDGFDAHRDTWHKTAAYKVFAETRTGALLESIAQQLLDQAPQRPDSKAPTPREAMRIVRELASRGVVLGLIHPDAVKEAAAGSADQGDDDGDEVDDADDEEEAEEAGSAQPGLIVVLPGAAGDDSAVKSLIERLSAARDEEEAEDEEEERTQELPGGRALILIDEEDAGYFVEGSDIVVAMNAPAATARLAIDALEGRIPNATKLTFEPDTPRIPFETVAYGFLDIQALGPMPPQAVQLGLDGLHRIESRWGFHEEAIISSVRVLAPAPRKGVLALIDQQTFAPDEMMPIPADLTSFIVVSVDGPHIIEVLKNLPEAGPRVKEALGQFRQRTRLDLETDVLSAFGPQWAFYLQPTQVAAPTTPLGGISTWFMNPPRLVMATQVRDREKLVSLLEKLRNHANVLLARQGAADAPKAVIEPLDLDDDNVVGFALNVPPAVFPLPAGVRPSLLLNDEIAALSINPETAAGAINPNANDDLNEVAAQFGDNLLVFSQTDPRTSVPDLIANIPFFLGLVAQGAREPNAPPFLKALARVEIDPDDVPSPESIRELLFPNQIAVSVDDKGLVILSRESLPGVSASPATAGVTVALLLPAVQAAREAARRAQCTNNLKQIGLAMHNYHDTNGHFPPPAITDSEGNPLLSWRVALLPYLEQAPLYNQFKLDEPWDSPHNKPLADRMPNLFTCPSHPGRHGEATTCYQAFVGPHTLLGDGSEPVSLAEITDGTSNTLMVVESSAEPVNWTEPRDIPYNEGDPRPSIRSDHPGGWSALFGDGSVRFMKTTIADAVLKALITRDGGEVISSEDINR